MNKPIPREEILKTLIVEVADSQAIEIEAVTPTSNFFYDLDGESIDLLEVSFRMQKRLGIPSKLQSFSNHFEFDGNGQISATSLSKLQSEFPSVDWPARFAEISNNDHQQLLTINLIADLMFDWQASVPASLETSHQIQQSVPA